MSGRGDPDRAVRGHARAAHRPASECRGRHTYLADGTQLCWRHDLPGRFALDAESCVAPPPHLAARWPGEEAGFWDAWVTAEVHAKLTGTPMPALVRRGLPVPSDPSVDTVVRRWSGPGGHEVAVCFGRLLP